MLSRLYTVYDALLFLLMPAVLEKSMMSSASYWPGLRANFAGVTTGGAAAAVVAAAVAVMALASMDAASAAILV